MNNIIDKRCAKRVNVSCEFRFRLLGSEEFHDACCIDLSSSGVLFCSEYAFQIGDRVEVQVIPDLPVRFSTTFMVKVVRIVEADHSEEGLFKIGAVIECGNSDAE